VIKLLVDFLYFSVMNYDIGTMFSGT